MTITARLSSDCIASVVASTIACVGPPPVLALCRRLIEAGLPSSADLECYRGETLALRVRSIGEAAGLEINSGGIGFTTRSKPRRGSLVSQTELGLSLPSS